GVWTQEREVRPRREYQLREQHEGLIRDVTIGKDHLVHVQGGDQAFQVGLRIDRDTIWVGRASEAGRETPVGNRGNLRGRKGYDLSLRLIAIATQEIVEVASGCSEDEHPAPR